jgi:outer membrane protein assembly factor BamE (lipoprotein component of BamABCDE complex)
LLALPGCAVFSDTPHYRGVAVTQHDLDQLTPGIADEADAQALLGPPTFVEQFDPNKWVYVSQITHIRIGQTEGVAKQHVVVLNFDDNGKLVNVTQDKLHNAVQVAMDSKQTPVPGGHAGFVQQLVGGVGSYNPLGGLTGGVTAPGAGGAGDIGGAGGGGGF